MLLVCAAGILLANMVYSYLNQKVQLQNEFDQTAANIANRLAFTMAQPLWNIDKSHLEQLERQELKNREVRAVLVVATGNDFSVGRRKPERQQADNGTIEEFSSLGTDVPSGLHRAQVIEYDNTAIGKVHIIFTDHFIHKKLSSLIVQQTLQALIILVCISILTYFGLSRILLSPLRELLQAAQAYGNGVLTARTVISSRDEIGVLGATLNRMAEQLTKTIAGIRQAEETVSSTNRRLNDILEFLPDAMFAIDTNGIVTTWNHAIEEMTGISAGQMLGKGEYEYARPFFGTSRPILIDLLRRPDSESEAYYKFVTRDGDKIIGESFIPLLNGHQNVYLWAVARPLYDIEGNCTGAIEIIRNITEQKIAESALRESEAFRKRVFESSKMPLVILDANSSQIIDCNPAAAEIYRFASVKETLGNTPVDVSAPLQYDGTPSAEKARMYIDIALRDGWAAFEWRHQRPNGELWDAEVHLMSFTSGDRQLLQYSLIDVTDRKKTAAIMIQTEKMIMIGGLAAGMAHEINNPLGIISQASQNILRRVSAELPANRVAAEQVGIDLNRLQDYFEIRQISTFIANIRDASERAARIIANMLKFSRKSESFREAVDLGQLLDQVLELAVNDYNLKKNYDFKKIEVVKECAADLPKVTVIVLELEQVLLNLFKNAAQAMYDAQIDRPQIALRTRQDNGHAVIEVEDTGPGIPEEVQKRIFEPFFTTKPVGIGTGLGLSVSYAIITNNHYGRLDVRSLPGEGTCFTIRLPLDRVAAARNIGEPA